MQSSTQFAGKMWRSLATILTLSLLTCPRAWADSDKAAHLGVSYMINTASYGIYRRAFGLNQGDALWMSMATTMLIGLTKEALDAKPDGHDVFANGIGTVLSVGTVLVFDF